MIITLFFILFYWIIRTYCNNKDKMATALACPRSSIPSNYFCKSCGLEAHHWIMDCSLLGIFHAARKLLKQAANNKDINKFSSKEREDSQELPDELIQIKCNSDHSITKCQSLYRIIIALRFYQNNGNDINALLMYFNRYPHLINDYTHILSAHLNQEKEMNDMNRALIYGKITQFVKCDLRQCPFYLRNNNNNNNNNISMAIPTTIPTNNSKIDKIIFYKNALNTIHCYFLHPIHTGFKMVRTDTWDYDEKERKSSVTPLTDIDNPTKDCSPSTSPPIHWNDDQLLHLQNELLSRKSIEQNITGIQYNQYNKFIIGI